MKRFLLFLLLVVAIVPREYAQAQNTGPPDSQVDGSLPKGAALPAPVLPAVTPEIPAPPTSILYPQDEGRKTRDLQLEWDELEISSMKNKERQAQITIQLGAIAQQVVTKLKVDMNLFEINAKDLKFVPKK